MSTQRTTNERGRAAKPNDIDTKQLFETIDAIRNDPSKGECSFFATTRWETGTTSETEISRYALGGEDIPQRYSMAIDEPNELLGRDRAPNPQMMLFAALNACILNTFIVNAAAKGVRVHRVEMETRGDLDLRGFLGIDDAVNPGYDALTIVCKVSSDGTREQLQACLDAGTKYSPNFQTVSRPVPIHYSLELA